MTTVKKCSSRKFCTLPEEYPFKNGKCRPAITGKAADFSKLIKFVDENVVGRNVTFVGPFGRRKVVYCDYTASARALNFIEDYILKDVLPLYGTSQTSTNVTSLQTALYRQEAHDIIRTAVHASDDDVVVFAGNGSTGALHKLIYSLDLEEPPVVFVGPSENNSVLLPWRETGAKIIRVAETKEGFLDLVDLELKLQIEKKLLNTIGSRAQFIGCFSAASNITGILADDIATTILLHQYGAYSFWDYGTAAPYVPLDMNPLLPGNDTGVHKDALYFSGHKFIGGLQSSGVLIAKRHILRTDLPERSSHDSMYLIPQPYPTYLQDVVKQEYGNGAIVNSVRMGLVMHLKQTIGPPNILIKEQKVTKTVLSFVRTIPEIILLGNGSHTVKRLPVFSFLVRHPRGVFLHHNFVCAVLNDVFGIQARGGCACAASYAYDLLGIDEKLSNLYEEMLSENRHLDFDNAAEMHSTHEMLRPGFSRISLPYFMSDSEVNYILEAVKMVATEGWKLLPQYVLYPETGEWKHRTNAVFRDRKWFSSFRFVDGKMAANERKISGQSPFPQDPSDCLQMARNIFNKARKMAHRYPLADQRIMFDENADKLRWFMLPSEAQDLLLGNCQKVKTLVPFNPGEYNGSRNGSVSSSTCDSARDSQKNIPALLDVSSMCCRHNSLTSFETSKLQRSSSFLGDKACSDYGCLSPFHSSLRREASPISRTRCYSLESSSVSPPSRLALVQNGHCSCGSQTDISDAESAKDGQMSVDFSDFGDMGITSLFPNSENENIQAYVKGVTEELASEIKTEIREVIATVDNVLSESMENLDAGSLPYEKRYSSASDFRRTSSTPMLSNANNSNQYLSANVNDKSTICYTSSLNNYSLANGHSNAGSRQRICSYDNKRPAVSCSDSQSSDVSEHVAVYLAELTSEMVTEMKSELREMVNAVDEIISPSNGDKPCLTSTPEQMGKQRLLSTAPKEEWESGDENQSHDANDCASRKIKEIKTVKNTDLDAHDNKSLSKSDSSTDSGVAEVSSSVFPIKSKRKISVIARSSPNVKDEIIETQMNVEFQIDRKECPVSSSFLDKRKRSFESVTLQPKWHCPPKSVWKPTVEAIREYDMIREGDRILVCLSGGGDSLSLLHTLHQYQYYSQSYGITFTFGAITIDPGNVVYDPRSLIPYLHALGVHYLYEEEPGHESGEESFASICDFRSHLKHSHLYETAKSNNYNVLALGQHFDDVVESFLMSMFYYGKLHSMKAHYYIRESNLRIIRPFIYVREKYLRQFAENRKLPIIAETCSSYGEARKERYRTKQLIAQQEILHPKLFSNLKSALTPLIGFKQLNQEFNVLKKNKYDGSDSPVFLMSDTEEEDEDEQDPN